MSDRGAEPSAEGEPAALDPDVGGRASAERSSQQHPGYPFVDFRAMCFNAYKGLHNGQTPAQRGEGKQFEAIIEGTSLGISGMVSRSRSRI